MLIPLDQKDLSRFMGVLTFLGRYIPSLAERTVNLREINKKGATWSWTKAHEKEFNDLKVYIVNPNKPVTLSVDNSRKGLGAAILQNGRPVGFASKTLTLSQKNYAPIELEIIAIVFGCTRFRQYLIGKRVDVESNHSALEFTFKKDLNSCPLGLQRFRIRLQEFDLSVKYKPGKLMYLADTLLRSPIDSDDVIEDGDMKAHVNLINYMINVSPEKQNVIRDEIYKDFRLIQLRNCITNGWPEYKHLPEEIKAFWSYRDEFSIINEIIYKDKQVVIPLSLQKKKCLKDCIIITWGL